MLARRRLEWRRTALDLPLALLVVLVLVQLTVGNRPIANWALAPPAADSDLPPHLLAVGTVSPERTVLALLTLLTYAAAYVLVVNLVRRRRQLDRLVRTLLLLGGVLALIGLLDYLTGAPWLIWWRLDPFERRLPGTFANPDHFATWLGMLVCLGVGYVFARARSSGERLPRREEAIRRYLPALAVVVMALALLFTLSRGGVLSLLVALGGLLVLQAVIGWTPRTFAVVGLTFATTLGYASWIGLEPFLRRAWHADYSLRWLQTITTLPMLASFPVLGVGLGAYRDIYHRYQTPALDPGKFYYHYAHNDLLQLTVEVGLVGALLCLWAVWRVSRDLVGAHLLGRATCPVGGGPGEEARRSDPFSVGIALGAVGGVMVLLVHSAVDFSARIPANGILAAALLGIATVALHTRFGVEREQFVSEVRRLALSPGRIGATGIRLAMVALALGATFFIVRAPVAATIMGLQRGSALSQAETAIAIDPTNVRLLQTRARLRLGSAQRVWSSGVVEDGRVLASWDERRQVALPLLTGAVGDLRAALSRRPSDPELHEELARVHRVAAATDPERRAEHRDAALAHFRRAILLAPEDPARYRALAVFAVRHGEPLIHIGLEAARGAIVRGLALLPQIVDELVETPLSEAQWLEIVPATAIDRLRLGTSLEGHRLLGPALHAYRRAVEVASPDEASLARWLLADVLARQRDHRGAAAELETALRQDPTNPELQLARARALAALGDPAALEAFRSAIVSAEALAAEARSQAVAGEPLPFAAAPPQAQALVRERLRAGEGMVRYYRALAEYLTDRRLWVQALSAWDIILASTPDDPAAHFARGIVLDGLGTADKAIEAYRKAVSLNGRSAVFRLRLAKRLWESEQFVQAMNEWRSIIAQHPGNLEARLALATAYVRSGQRIEASREYQRVLEMVPGHDEARQGLARLGVRPGS